MPLQYQVQNRYQDSGWEPVEDGLYVAETFGDAIRRAEELSRDGMFGGMCRVMELGSRRVMVEFPAGHPPYRVTVGGGVVLALTEIPKQQTITNRDSHAYMSGFRNEMFVRLGPGRTINSMLCRPDVPAGPDSLDSSIGDVYPDIGPVTAPGPDLPTIENRAPRGIHLRNKPNRGS